MGLAPIARRAGDEVRSPRLLAERVLRRIAWSLRARRYRRMLAAGALLRVPGAEPAAVTFSVVMPVYRVQPGHLEAAIDSVLGQTHRRLELVLVDDASPDPAVRAVLDRRADDPRVRLVRLPSNRGIAAATDAGIETARGEWIAFVDHDDLLHPRALEVAARRLSEWPDTGWLFSDEDTIDAAGRPGRPIFKPGFSRHLLLSVNHAAHARIVRRDLLEALGGHRRDMDGAQDWDLALRALASGTRFGHLPGVLYHWRRVPGSMARGAAEKPAAREAASVALERFGAAIPGAAKVRVRPLLPAVSLFELSWEAAPELGVTVLGGAGASGGRVRERVPVEGWDPEAIVRAAARATEPFLCVAPGTAVAGGVIERLLAAALVPGTAVAAARGVQGHRVTASGWWGVEGGTVRDPWAGLLRRAAGPFDLALLPGPRLLPPPTVWVTRREAVLEAWESASEIGAAWRLAVGWYRLGLEVVTIPGADVAVKRPAWPGPSPVPEAWREASWWRELGFSGGSGSGKKGGRDER